MDEFLKPRCLNASRVLLEEVGDDHDYPIKVHGGQYSYYIFILLTWFTLTVESVKENQQHTGFYSDTCSDMFRWPSTTIFIEVQNSTETYDKTKYEET